MGGNVWGKSRLGDLVTINPDTLGRNWPYKHICYVDISSVTEGRIQALPRRLNLSDAPSRAKRLLQNGDTVLSTVRPNRRSMFFANQPERDWVVSTGFAILRPKIDMIVPRFLYACVFDQVFTDYLVSREKGAAYPAISSDDIANALIPFPPIKEQRAIAHILGTLDDKIELNRNQNETLEAMARALFKAWFVDFLPVRAKMAARTQTGEPVRAKLENRLSAVGGLPAHLYDLFPDRLVDSELGEIPEGWEIKKIKDFTKITSGKRPPSRSPSQDSLFRIPLWGSNGPMAFAPTWLFHEPLLLTGRVGTLGSVFRVNETCWPSDNVLVIIPKELCFLEYLYFQLRKIDFLSLNRGSTQPLLTQGDLQAQQLLSPSKLILEEFNHIVSKIYQILDQHEYESRTLAQLRDTLLPKLISGELRVADAEFFLKERGL